MLPLLVLALPVAAQAAETPGGCEGLVRQTPPPAYPAALIGTGTGGVVVLVLDLDPCGRAVDVQVEASSGNRALDGAAIETAKAWVLPDLARANSGRRVRIPFDFTRAGRGFANAAATPPSGRARDAYFMQRRSQVATAPPRDADGSLRGYVPDPFPIGVASVDEAQALVERHGRRQASPVPSVDVYQVADEEGFSFWAFDRSAPGRKAVMRQRLVEDRGRGFYVTSLLCEPAGDRSCDAFRTFVESMPSQPDPGRPLPPPPLGD